MKIAGTVPSKDVCTSIPSHSNANHTTVQHSDCTQLVCDAKLTFITGSHYDKELGGHSNHMSRLLSINYDLQQSTQIFKTDSKLEGTWRYISGL